MEFAAPAFFTKQPSKPFVPVRVIPVDLAPHTLHCCLVMLFERVDPLKYEVLPGGPMGPMPLPVPPMMGPPLGPRPPIGPCGPGGLAVGPAGVGPRGPRPLVPPPLCAPRPGPGLRGPGPMLGPRGPGPRPGPGLRGPGGPRPLNVRPLVRGPGPGPARMGPRPPQPPGHPHPPAPRGKGRGGLMMPRPRNIGGDNFYQDDPLDGPSFFGPEADVQPPLPPTHQSVFW